MIYPIVLAGGIGERLWPLSREVFPKQFVRLYNSYSTFQHVVSLNNAAPVVVSNIKYQDLVREQLLEVGVKDYKLILENEKVGTAVSIALAASILKSDDVLLVLPSDFILKDRLCYLDVVRKVSDYVRVSRLLTSIVVPAENGSAPYGYLRLSNIEGAFYSIQEFIEKPRSLIKNYNDYYWNTGIFICEVSTYLSYLRRYSPSLLSLAYGLLKGRCSNNSRVMYLNNLSIPVVDNLSVDRVLMEKCSKNSAFIGGDDWFDVGNWDALSQFQTEVVSVYKNNPCYEEVVIKVVMKSGVVVACVHDCIYLVRLSKINVYNHCTIKRWGSYNLLYYDRQVKIKCLVLEVGKSTSLQLHNYRTEDWVIISGVGKVIVGNNIHTVSRGAIFSIPKNCCHQIQNTSNREKLILLEIQLGSILCEDDIIRL